MAELTQEQIIEAIKTNPDLGAAVLPHVIDTDKGKEIINNRATSIYTEKIGDEVKKIHTMYDDNVFEKLGERPGVGEDGNKVKTYEFIKTKMEELAELRKQKDSLTKDAEVQRLTQQIETLKAEGGGKHWETTFNTEKSKWEQKEADYKKQIEQLGKGVYESKVSSDIKTGLMGLKFNPDVPESARKALIQNVENNLLANSKEENGQLVYLDEKGSIILDAEHKPQTAKGILEISLADILLKNDGGSGGGADPTIKGSIQTEKVEGKDDKKSLILTPGSFKTKVEFADVAHKALIAEGIAKNDPDYKKLIDEAYGRYEVNKLPRQ